MLAYFAYHAIFVHIFACICKVNILSGLLHICFHILHISTFFLKFGLHIWAYCLIAYICVSVLIVHIYYPSWQWHRTGSQWFPVRTLPVAPLWCDLGFVPNSRGNKAAAYLRPITCFSNAYLHIFHVYVVLHICIYLHICAYLYIF